MTARLPSPSLHDQVRQLPISLSETGGISVGHHLSVLRAEGPDAEKFLQGQLTADVQLAASGALPAMHLDIKGRGLFSHLVIRQGSQHFQLLTPAERAAEALQYLKKYAVFSKVTLSLDDHLWPVLTTTAVDVPDSHPYPLGTLQVAVLDTDALEALSREHVLAGYGQWLRQDTALGLSHIWQGGAGRFLPQELNYDLLQGVSFKKGCYLGQEIVARMHFKGQLKQRLARLTLALDSVEPGTLLRNAQQQAVAEVAQSVTVDDHCEALAVLKHQHEGPLYLDGTPLSWERLTVAYTIPT